MANYQLPSLQDLLEAGVHFGHQVRRGDPRMNQFIYGVRGGVHIINLETSEQKLKEAAEVLFELGKQGKTLLFVGTKKQAQDLIKEAATKTNSPYVLTKWMGGTLTNFDEIKRNLKKLADLKNLKDKGELTKYTKREQLLITRKLEKFDLNWGGVEKMDKLPDALFVVDCVAEKTALLEAQKLGIPVIGVVDTNSNPFLVTYPIPANDDATKSLKLVIETVGDIFAAGQKASGTKLEEEEEKKEVEPKKTKKSSTKKGEEKTEEAIEDAPIAEEIAAAEEEVEKEIMVESKREG